MIINTSNKFVGTVVTYFTNMNETYNRKQFALVILLTTIFILGVYGLGTDWTQFKALQQQTMTEVMNLSTTHGISHEQAINKLSADADVINTFNDQMSQIMPSTLWMCLMLLLTIPAIIKRTNDTSIARSLAYPVAIYYVIYTLQVLFGTTFDFFGFFTALSVYTFFFVFIISLMPGEEK